MRKIEIYKEQGDMVEEEPIRVKFKRSSLNRITVIAVDEKGVMVEDGNLVNISPKGIYLIGGVSKDIGFELDHNRCLKVLE